MGDRLNASQVFQLQIREIIRSYVRELAGWDKKVAHASFIAALELIERAWHDPNLAAELLAAEPSDLDDLLNGAPTKVQRNPRPGIGAPTGSYEGAIYAVPHAPPVKGPTHAAVNRTSPQAIAGTSKVTLCATL
jgi:hypothetical protein